MSKLNPKILLSVWVYLGWFGCVYFGRLGWAFASLIFPLISWVLMRLSFGLNRQRVFQLLFLFYIGVSFDYGCAYFNLIELNPSSDIGWLPVWLISLWLLFISSIPLIQSLFQKKYFLASLLGAIFGPLSYRAGAQFGVLIMNGTVALIVYGVFWAIYIPAAIFWLGRKGVESENT